ncbi:Serine/threonine-protein kinase-like protein CCR1 [Morella rubra]|uniref:Serine/threonine-protein kinase-like protein CCR1 n=1 Tax=Morella rubra TaxID=262757 RepID=A0A6A1UQV8_9ROSI|nr:Serine/threonine-protein kinase-like protein CCR1 [Morella rubra]
MWPREGATRSAIVGGSREVLCLCEASGTNRDALGEGEAVGIHPIKLIVAGGRSIFVFGGEAAKSYEDGQKNAEYNTDSRTDITSVLSGSKGPNRTVKMATTTFFRHHRHHSITRFMKQKLMGPISAAFGEGGIFCAIDASGKQNVICRGKNSSSSSWASVLRVVLGRQEMLWVVLS